MGFQSGMGEMAPFAAMVFVECGEVAMTVLTKAAFNTGMNNFVFSVYYNALGILILLPYFIFQIYRNRPPPITFALLRRFCLLGLLGKSLVMLGVLGLDYSSPSLAAALANLTPVYTFLLAVIFGMEKLDMRKRSTVAKCLGTVLAVAGALTVTLYRGPFLFSLSDNSSPGMSLAQAEPLRAQADDKHSNWVLGGLLLAGGYIFGSLWSIVQAATVKEYPAQTTVTFFYVLFGTIQCAVLSMIIERDPRTWRLVPGVQFTAIVYSAAFGTAIRYCVLTWCLDKRGPLYVALFKPLGMVVAVIAGVIFLGDILYLGSLIGAGIIAVGFYTVTWAQSEENSSSDDSHSGNDVVSPSGMESHPKCPTTSVPLLQDHDTKCV